MLALAVTGCGDDDALGSRSGPPVEAGVRDAAAGGADARVRPGLRDAGDGAASSDAGDDSLPVWHRTAGPTLELLASDASVALGAGGRPVVAWLVLEAVPALRAARIEGERWRSFVDTTLAGFDAGDRDPAIHVDGAGRVSVAWVEGETGVAVRSYEDGSFGPKLAPYAGAGRITALDLTVSEGAPVLALVEEVGAQRAVHVLRYDPAGQSWQALGPPVDAARAQNARRIALGANEAGQLAAAWLENDGHSDNLYLARYTTEVGWTRLGTAIDLELDARVLLPALVLHGDELLVGWNEGPFAALGAYVARFTGRFQVLGGALDDARASSVLALANDAEGAPLALLQTYEGLGGSRLSILRYEGGPEPPFGLAERPPATCSLPEDTEPTFPGTLSETGCFDDVPSRTPAAGLIPYTLSSPLWSDGTLKRRFLVIPDGEAIGYTESDAWLMPVGTVLIKEFLLARTPGDLGTAQPIETRFLVKRCEPGGCRSTWQGYSYRWDEAGTEAHLLDNDDDAIVVEWTVGGTVQRHSYPGRGQCERCHANAAGGALGLQTPQLNRNHEYGAIVDNQVRALGHIGLFGSSFVEPSESALVELGRLPTPGDPAWSNEQRARSYLHANCSFCHRADGRWPVIDLRFDAPAVAPPAPYPNICDKIVPGDAGASMLFVKMGTRGPLPPEIKGDPMPPLATLLVDERQLAVMRAWIDEMTDCP